MKTAVVLFTVVVLVATTQVPSRSENIGLCSVSEVMKLYENYAKNVIKEVLEDLPDIEVVVECLVLHSLWCILDGEKFWAVLILIRNITLSTIATKKSGKAFASHKDSLKTKGSHHHGDYEGPDEEGYYKFIEAKTARPPQVRPPPYFKSSLPCEGAEKPFVAGTSHGNLCGDLNSGIIPTNPFHQSFDGDPYPFEQVTTSTLQFFSKTLPILQKDETVPKVISYNRDEMKYFTTSKETHKESPKRVKRQDKTTLESALMALKDFLLESTDILNITRRARKFCENGNGMVCLLYKAIQGEPLGVSAEERKDDGSTLHEMSNGVEGPPTPCPAKVEYATPVFARNYQGIWRYVVQIPYEGYFTQTVEVTTCLGPRCHYLEGKCLSSPRWMSLLVAEIFYPGGLKDTARRQETDPYVFENVTVKSEEERCDGVDKNGCYQVRLYYDWFLVPGSCKCWKPDYLHKFSN